MTEFKEALGLSIWKMERAGVAFRRPRVKRGSGGYSSFGSCLCVRSKTGLPKGKRLAFAPVGRKSPRSYCLMTPLNVPYASLHSSALVLVFKSRKVAVRQVPAEGMSLVPSATLALESSVTQPVEVKAKRKRKTKSEYAALALLPVELKEKDKHKGGRPKLEDKEELKCVSSLVSVACHDWLHAAADRQGISVSRVIRWLIDGAGTKRVEQRMGQLMRQGLSEEERKQLRDLAGMAANLNQAAKLANRDGYAAHATALVDLGKKIREQVNAFNK
jgi:hypothetical protein